MKRVLTMCLAVLMAFYLMPQTAHAEAATVTITVKADKTTVNPGDTVKFDVMLGAVTDLAGLDFYLSVPQGLTCKDDDFTIQEGLEDILKADGDGILIPKKASGYRWMYTTGRDNYTAASELCILSFSCTVDENSAFESKSVGITPEICFVGSNYDELEFNIVPAAVTVEKKVIAVSGVSLNKSSITLQDGETSKLTATVEPGEADNKNVSWSSDNEAVATVAADGTVTAVKGGTANIIVTTQDGNKTASCAVTVNCSHVMTKTDAVAPTCDTAGNVEYWTCSKCNRNFADEAGTRELTSVTDPAKGHTGDTWTHDENNHWKICTVCGKEFDKTEHTYKWIVDQAATEDATGIGHEECVCGSRRSEDTVIPKLDHVHTGITHHEAVEATCKTKGSVEYWTCSSDKCKGKYYGDAACQIAISSLETPVNPNNHVYDNDSDAECNLCGNKREVPASGSTNNSGNASNNKEASQTSGNSTAPKTGDESTSALWIGLLMICVAFAAGALNNRGKSHIEK